MDNAVAYPRFRWFVAIASSWAWLSFGVLLITFAPMLPIISREFHVPIGGVLIGLFALNSVARGTGVIFAGPLVDRFGPRNMLLASAICLFFYCLLIPACSHTLTALVVLRLFQGLADGPLFASQAALVHRWFPQKEQGTIIGINNGIFACGTALLYIMLPILMPLLHGNWRLVSASPIVLVAIQVVLMLITLFGKEPASEWGSRAGAVAQSNADFRTALALPVFWAGAYLLGSAQGIMQTVNGLTASFLMAPPPLGLGWKPAAAGPTLTCIQLGMIVAGVLMGAILASVFRGNAKWLAALSFLLVGVAAFTIALPFSHPSPQVIRYYFFVTGFMMNLGFPAVSTFITVSYPPQILGKIFGISSGISVYGGAIFSGVAGALLDKTHSFTSVYGLVLGIGVVAFLVAATMMNPVKAFRVVTQGTPVGAHR